MLRSARKKQKLTNGLPLFGRTNKVLYCGFSWQLLVVGWSDVFQIPKQTRQAANVSFYFFLPRHITKTLPYSPPSNYLLRLSIQSTFGVYGSKCIKSYFK